MDLTPISQLSSKQFFLCSLSTWHAHLAHASIKIVRHILLKSQIKSLNNDHSLCHAF